MILPAWSQFALVSVVIVGIFASHFAYFTVLPTLLPRLKFSAASRRRWLERVVASPSLLGDIMRVPARDQLMRQYLMESRHEDAARQGFAILRHTRLPSAISASVRDCLAHALEGLGRADEANAQRKQAEADLARAPRDHAWYYNRGRQLAARDDFAGASTAYEQGLALVPPGKSEPRTVLSFALSNALYRAGRLQESARVADEATRVECPGQILIGLHRQAGASYADLHRLDEAEYHKSRVVNIAETLDDPVELTNALAELAGIHRNRGKLSEALTTCDRAARLGRTTRPIELLRLQVFGAWGRFDEALAAGARAAELDPLPIAMAEERMQGIFAFSRAFLLLELGRLDEVPGLLESARGQFRRDSKYTLWCDALAVCLAAHQGRREDALRAFPSVELKMAEFAQDRNTLSGVLGSLGRASVLLGEYHRALGLWQAYLAIPPLPVDLPTAHYFLGEVHRGLGDEPAARSAYRAAVETGLETHFARLAQSRLRSLPGI